MFDLGRWLQHEGHQVAIVSRSAKVGRLVEDGIDYEAIVVSRKESFFGLYFVFPLRSLMYFWQHRKDFDIIHCVAAHPMVAILASLIRLMTRSKVVREVATPTWPLLRSLKFDATVCTSLNLQRRFGSDAILINRAIDVGSFQGDRALRFGGRFPFVVGTLGTAEPRRGLDVFARAVPYVLEKHPDTCFLLAIPEAQAEYSAVEKRGRERIQKLTSVLGIDDRARIIGEVDVRVFFKFIDLFVFPVQSPRMMADIPTTLLESLASGCPIVTSRKGAIPEIIEDGRNGLMVSADDYANPRAYAAKINDLLGDPQRMREIGVNGRESVRRFDVNVVGPRFVALYEELMQQEERATND